MEITRNCDRTIVWESVTVAKTLENRHGRTDRQFCVDLQQTDGDGRWYSVPGAADLETFREDQGTVIWKWH